MENKKFNIHSEQGEVKKRFEVQQEFKIYDDSTPISEVEPIEDLLNKREQYFLDFYVFNKKDENYHGEVDHLRCYNICPVAGNTLGFKHTEKSLIKMSGKNNHMYGKRRKKETCNKISMANIGKVLSKETRQKISKAHK